MQLSLLAYTPTHIHVGATGDIFNMFTVEVDPLAAVLGATPYANNLLLNLETAKMIDSSGIGWLITCHKRFVQNKHRFIIHSIPPLILQVLSLVHIDRIIECAADHDAATRLLESPVRTP